MIGLGRFLAWVYLVCSLIVAFVGAANADNYFAVGMWIGVGVQGLTIFCLLMLVAQIAENTQPAQAGETTDKLSSLAEQPKKNPIQNEALHNAVWGGDYATARQLILDGADVNHKNAAGKTSLDLAKERKDDLIVKLLHSYGAV